MTKKPPRTMINATFRDVSIEIDSLDQIFTILQNTSKNYRTILALHLRYQLQRDDKICQNSSRKIDTIAKQAKCNEKTVDRFNRDMKCLVYKKNIYIKGKQTSNTYHMKDEVFYFLKALNRLGIFRTDDGVSFQCKLNWMMKLWEKCNFEWGEFVNKVYNRKPYSSNDMRGSYKQPEKKMSHGFQQKCPTTFYFLSSLFEEYGTEAVPVSKIKEMSESLDECVRKMATDVRWYAKNSRNPIRNYSGLMKNRLRASCEMRK